MAVLFAVGCDRSERFTLTIHNPDGTTSEVETTVAAFEKEMRTGDDKYHHVNIVIHADGSIQKQAGEMISDSEFVGFLNQDTKKEKMVTFVTDMSVLIERYNELNELAKNHGIKAIRMINKEAMAEPDSRGNKS